MAEVIKRKVVGCARCSEAHEELEFKPLTRPVRVFEDVRKPLSQRFDTNVGAQLYTHWASCPTNGEPILLRVLPPSSSCCVGGRCCSRLPGRREAQPVVGKPVTQEQLDAVKSTE